MGGLLGDVLIGFWSVFFLKITSQMSRNGFPRRVNCPMPWGGAPAHPRVRCLKMDSPQRATAPRPRGAAHPPTSQMSDNEFPRRGNWPTP